MSDDPVMDEAARIIWEAGEQRLGPAADRGEALERAREVSPPQTAAVKHGLHLPDGVGLLCDRCRVADHCELHRPGERCAIERELVPRRRREISQVLAADGYDPQLYTSLIESAVYAEVRLARGGRYLNEHDEIRDGEQGADYTGVAKHFVALQRALDQAPSALHLSPASRRQLEAQRAGDGGPPNAYGVAVHEVDAEAVDVPFEAEGEDDGGNPAQRAGATGNRERQ